MVFHSLVIPVFNEFKGIETLHKRVFDVIEKSGEQFEVILVNDGSRDGSDGKLDAVSKLDPRFKVVHLSRNFGHQIAITAGIEWASGNTVTVMDADLQDPPELILEFLKKWQEGFDVVYAVRKTRPGETRFKLWTASLFYKLIRSITHFDVPMNTGDFRLMDRKAVDAFLSLPERNRYIRGLVAWVGFRQIGVPYDRESRDSGETHYTLTKMMKLAFDGITSFSVLPLRLATFMGFATSVVAFMGAGWSLYLKFMTDKTVPGWTSLMLVSLFLGGIQLLAIGIIGEYMGRIFDEVRARPLYFTQKTVGFEKERQLRKVA